MKLQRLYSLTRQAIDCYYLIDNGDHIAVGISGGKDSLTLLYALQGLKNFKDDLVETMLLSLVYEGRFYAFSSYTYLDRTELAVIRPLIYVSEADVIRFKNKYSLPVCKSSCPIDGHTKRKYVKQLTKIGKRKSRSKRTFLPCDY